MFHISFYHKNYFEENDVAFLHQFQLLANRLFKFSLLQKQAVIFFKLWFTAWKAEQPLQGMELQEKEAQQDYSIYEICLERTYS